MKLSFKGVVLAAAVVLVACGGGDGNGDPPASTARIAGYWSDEDSSTLITENGEIWTFQQIDSDLLLGMGHLSLSGNGFTGSVTHFMSPTNAVSTLKGTFVERKSLSGTVSSGGETHAIAMQYDNEFDRTPSLALATGSWTFVGGATVTVTTAGAISANLGGCTLSGKLTADASGKNFFRLSGNFGPAPCTTPGAAVAGILTADASSIVMGVASGAIGGAFVVDKP